MIPIQLIFSFLFVLLLILGGGHPAAAGCFPDDLDFLHQLQVDRFRQIYAAHQFELAPPDEDVRHTVEYSSAGQAAVETISGPRWFGNAEIRVEWEYDLAGRPRQSVWSCTSPRFPNGPEVVRYQYGPGERMATQSRYENGETEPTGIIVDRYDDGGQVVEERISARFDLRDLLHPFLHRSDTMWTSTISYVYDSVGRVIVRRTGSEIRYTEYDTAGNLAGHRTDDRADGTINSVGRYY